jgi:hypothetical protein
MEFTMKLTCPNEEMIADYLEGRLSQKERSAMEAHLADCDSCLDALIISNELLKNMEDFELSQVPPEITQSAIDLILREQPSISLLDGLKRYLNYIKSKLLDLGMVFWGDWELSPVRGKRIVSAKGQSFRRKNFKGLETDIQIEKIGANYAQIRIIIDKSNKNPKVRATLLRQEREVASYLLEDNFALFENIPFSHYKLRFTRDGEAIGEYRFQIK